MTLFDRSADASPIGKVEATGLMIALLAALSALGQFATNIYLPSLPAIAAEYGAADALAQLTLTAYLVGFAVTQLVYGPISDRLGRRPLLGYGVLVFIAGSVVCVIAPTMELLILGRIVQAVGAAASLVVARAVVRDSFEGAQLQRVMALVSMFFALVPGMSPFLGGIIHDLAGWRWIFVLTGVLGALVFVWMWFRLPETLEHRLPRLDLGELARGYRIVLGLSLFRRYALANLCIFAAMFAFFGGSPKTYIDELGVTAAEYGLYPPLSSVGFIIGGLFVRRMVGRISGDGICRIGLAVLLAGCIVMVVLPGLGIVHKHGFNAAIIIFISGLGIFLPTAIASALQSFPERAGTASAMLGFLQMGGAAAGSALVAVFQDEHPVLAFPLVMLVATTLGIAFFALEGRDRAVA